MSDVNGIDWNDHEAVCKAAWPAGIRWAKRSAKEWAKLRSFSSQVIAFEAIHNPSKRSTPEPRVWEDGLPALKSATHEQCGRAQKRKEFIHTYEGELETLIMREDELKAALAAPGERSTPGERQEELRCVQSTCIDCGYITKHTHPGAEITCPQCGHVGVVRAKPDPQPSPVDELKARVEAGDFGQIEMKPVDDLEELEREMLTLRLQTISRKRTPFEPLTIEEQKILWLTDRIQALIKRGREAEKLAAYLDSLQSKYSLQFARETTDRMKWQVMAMTAEQSLQAEREKATQAKKTYDTNLATLEHNHRVDRIESDAHWRTLVEAEREKSALADKNLEEVMKERDEWEERLTQLAEEVGSHFRVEVGEWSNCNDPGLVALAIVQGEYKTDSDQDRQVAALIEKSARLEEENARLRQEKRDAE